MTDKFSWDELEDDLAIKEQRAVAVYENPRGDTVIRQAADAIARRRSYRHRQPQ